MADEPVDGEENAVREIGARCEVSSQGQPVAVLLTLDEYEHYLGLLGDEADSRDPALAARLRKAASPSGEAARKSFQEYLTERQTSRAQVSR